MSTSSGALTVPGRGHLAIRAFVGVLLVLVLAIGAVTVLANIGDEPNTGGSITRISSVDLTFAEKVAAMDDVHARRRAP